MHNLRFEDGEFIYDCDGVDCPTPDKLHRVSVEHVLAALEVTYREFMFHLDPRAEALDVVLQYMYQAMFHTKEAAPTGCKAPWENAFERLVREIDGHYSSREEEIPRKELLN